jgi:Cu/Ag efflux pump CusA
MAFAVMGGLLVATVLTLVLLPVLYVAWFSGKSRDDVMTPTETPVL